MYIRLIFLLILFKRMLYALLNYFGFYLQYQIKYCSDNTVDTKKYGLKLTDIYKGNDIKLIVYGKEREFIIHIGKKSEKKIPPITFNISYSTPSFNNLYERGIDI